MGHDANQHNAQASRAMTDDALRAECEQWFMQNQDHFIYDRALFIDKLVRLCQRQRAETWRAAAKMIHENSEPVHKLLRSEMKTLCEAQAAACEKE